MKPVHFLFVDHHIHETTHSHSDGGSASLHQDCDICLFMLQSFTPQKFVELQHYYYTSYAELMQSIAQTWAYEFLPTLFLRGPPSFCK